MRAKSKRKFYLKIIDYVVQGDFLKAASLDGFLKGRREGKIPARRKSVWGGKFMCVCNRLGIPSAEKSTCTDLKSLNSSLSLVVHILVMSSKH